jgi:hypothetical protein
LSEGTTLRRVRYPEIGARTRATFLDRLPVGPGEVELRAGVVVALLGNPLALVETLHPLEGGARRLEANPRLLVVEGGVVRREENHRTVPLDEVTNPIEDLRDGVGEGRRRRRFGTSRQACGEAQVGTERGRLDGTNLNGNSLLPVDLVDRPGRFRLVAGASGEGEDEDRREQERQQSSRVGATR